MKDYFVSTAPWYKKFRPFYPKEILEQIVGSFGLSVENRVLDIGAGTGQLAIGLSPFVREVVAVDPDGEMIRYGQELAREHGIKNIKWICASSEELDEFSDLGKFKIATFGASFHWVNQEELLKQLDKRIEPNGGVVVTGSTTVWHPSEGWEEKVKEVIQKHLGEERRAGTGKFLRAAKTDRRFEEIIQESPFSNLMTFEYKVPISQTTDEVVGRMFSTSFANPAVLGQKKEAFEKDLRATLEGENPDGIFEKTDKYYLFVAKRPNGQDTQET